MRADLERLDAWTAHCLRSAAEEVRTRVGDAVRRLRSGVPVAPSDLDDVCLDLAEIVRGLGDVPTEHLGPDDAAAVGAASVAVGGALELVSALLRDLPAPVAKGR